MRFEAGLTQLGTVFQLWGPLFGTAFSRSCLDSSLRRVKPLFCLRKQIEARISRCMCIQPVDVEVIRVYNMLLFRMCENQKHELQLLTGSVTENQGALRWLHKLQ